MGLDTIGWTQTAKNKTLPSKNILHKNKKHQHQRKHTNWPKPTYDHSSNAATTTKRKKAVTDEAERSRMGRTDLRSWRGNFLTSSLFSRRRVRYGGRLRWRERWRRELVVTLFRVSPFCGKDASPKSLKGRRPAFKPLPKPSMSLFAFVRAGFRAVPAITHIAEARENRRNTKSREPTLWKDALSQSNALYSSLEWKSFWELKRQRQ